MTDAVTRAADALRTMITSGQLTPRSGLTQVGLAQEIGVSTAPVREALRLLEAEGLLESQQNGRPRVPSFDPADLDGVYCNRVLLESARDRALGVSAEHREAHRGPRAPPGPCATPRIPAVWDGARASFHLGLMAGNSDALQQEIARLVTRSDLYRRLSVRVDDSDGRRLGDEEHATILAACQARDGGQAALLLARHLTRSAVTLIAHLEPDTIPPRLAERFRW